MSVSVDVGVMWRLSEDFNRRFGLRMQPAPPVGQHSHPHPHSAVHHHYHHHHQHHQHPHTSMIFNGKRSLLMWPKIIGISAERETPKPRNLWMNGGEEASLNGMATTRSPAFPAPRELNGTGEWDRWWYQSACSGPFWHCLAVSSEKCLLAAAPLDQRRDGWVTFGSWLLPRHFDGIFP